MVVLLWGSLAGARCADLPLLDVGYSNVWGYFICPVVDGVHFVDDYFGFLKVWYATITKAKWTNSAPPYTGPVFGETNIGPNLLGSTGKKIPQ